MSNYEFPLVRRNKFKPDESLMRVFADPCCWCEYRHGLANEEPCNTCDHNLCASLDDGVA